MSDSKPLRSEIFDTHNSKIKSARIVINAPAAKIFDLLANPRRHPDIDGTHTVVGIISGPERLFLDAKFGMNMHLGVSYRISNTVVEFEDGKLIAWRHLGRWRWRYQLRTLSPTQTEVTETFDGTKSIFQLWLRIRRAYPWAQMAVAKSLVSLKEISEKEFTA